MYRFLLTFFCFSLLLLSFSEVNAQDTLEKTYRKYCTEFLKDMSNSDYDCQTPSEFDTPYYEKIIRMGPEIIPYVNEDIKPLIMRTRENKIPLEFFCLDCIFSYLVLTDGASYGNPWCNDTVWWDGGRELAQERFNLLYAALEKGRIENNQKSIDQAKKSLRSLGIYSLVFVMDKIEVGDNDLIPIVTDMFTDRFGGPPVASDREVILKWWKENRKRYTLPPQKKDFKLRLFPVIIDPRLPEDSEEYFNGLYESWKEFHTVPELVALSELIGYENTTQYQMLQKLDKKLFPFLWLKLKEDKYNLPILEKIEGRTFTPEEIEAKIKKAEEEISEFRKKQSDGLMELRTWHSAQGKFSVEARFISATENDVVLNNEKGTKITVPLERLSVKDREYVRECLDKLRRDE